jgi:hypothetical protein
MGDEDDPIPSGRDTRMGAPISSRQEPFSWPIAPNLWCDGGTMMSLMAFSIGRMPLMWGRAPDLPGNPLAGRLRQLLMGRSGQTAWRLVVFPTAKSALASATSAFE